MEKGTALRPMNRTVSAMASKCPYGADECPKIKELDRRIDILEKNQIRVMRMVYYIAGIVSVSLGITVMV